LHNTPANTSLTREDPSAGRGLFVGNGLSAILLPSPSNNTGGCGAAVNANPLEMFRQQDIVLRDIG